ncbi:GntR family transcriptional regulator [Pseudooceanicola nanhaiensis]|uniref:GntR family transcriptional regulator n=1 Tax=Pseudooceanicola nanhaiensis TaxID=375761 RepID=UPI001CD5B76C|nr:GntR family transcriptional regulator [Pseudooceanicola nanhaiensis]MCA0918782.1 GntR family transcriptional regulator [Pseudooceanicola nanhaiensis]
MRFEHQTLNERAYHEIRRQLVSGAVKPGQPLVIRTLAADFGISVTPVRDAMLRLVAERLLVMMPNRTFAVPVLTQALLREASEIRVLMEGLATRKATPNLKLSHLHRLQGLVLEGTEAAEAGDSPAYTRINQEFHFTIYEQAQAPILLQKITELWSQVGPYFSQLLVDGDYVPHANEPHQRIVEALQARDADLASKEIARDIESATHSLVQHFPEQEGLAAAF